jgi:N-acetylmuramic acid 6-phosphate (MurNAc-6-P) etherase
LPAIYYSHKGKEIEGQHNMDDCTFDINENDVVIGIAASGTTPYVIGGWGL